MHIPAPNPNLLASESIPTFTTILIIALDVTEYMGV
jgi:hypothetical protein